MKKIITMLCAIASLNVLAEQKTVVVDGVSYEIHDNYAVATTDRDNSPEGDIVVKDYIELDGISYPVTKIGIGVSYEGQNVVLPNTIVDIYSVCSAKLDHMPESVENIYLMALWNVELPSETRLPAIKDISPEAFVETKGVKKIIIGSQLKALGEGAFADSEVEVVEFEDRLDSELKQSSFISDAAFYYASNLKELKFPKWADVEYGDCAVLSCENLERVIFPDVPTIKYGYHKRYTNVMLEGRYVPIYGYLFRDCPKLKEIVCMGETPARITNIDNFKEKCNSILYEEIYSAEEFTFMDNMDGCVLKVPAGSEELYRADPVWGRFQTILGFENGDYNLVSINSVEADKDATPVYYNLQGIQVKEPVKGQLYIRKDGAETTKVIM